jgi:SpoVK/Ycf46/Vps4 family AAA+-type ATPase
MADDGLIESLQAAVDARPEDGALRLHFAELLLDAGRRDEAISQAAAVLQRAPTEVRAHDLLRRAMQPAAATEERANPAEEHEDGFDWAAAERELEGVIPPRYSEGPAEVAAVRNGPGDGLLPLSVEAAGLTLADVGGLDQVKQRLEAAFLAPLRNPEVRRLYGKSLRGGLLLWGPPGCGKTFIARALAGELGAAFASVSITDVLDPYVGVSERNLHDVFARARQAAPCVVFLDEIDAIGGKRSHNQGGTLRNVVNQLLLELDDVNAGNDGVFVLAASNAPWDVDAALRRPGRLDRAVLVLPPDDAARRAVLARHLAERPIERIDLAALAQRTEGFSGADLAHLCESAAELAVLDSVRTGDVRMIGMADFEAALGSVRSSIGSWIDIAVNVVQFANASHEYDELAAWLKRRRR